jgi:hypothetical protein
MKGEFVRGVMTGCLVTFFSHNDVAFGPDRMSSTRSSPSLPTRARFMVCSIASSQCLFSRKVRYLGDDGLLGHLLLTTWWCVRSGLAVINPFQPLFTHWRQFWDCFIDQSVFVIVIGETFGCCRIVGSPFSHDEVLHSVPISRQQPVPASFYPLAPVSGSVPLPPSQYGYHER